MTDSRHVFISHATADDAFVKELRIKLELSGIKIWVDSRNLRGGDKLWPEVAEAIRTARHVLVVISPETINSDWVFDEIKLAEQVEKEQTDYRVIPLMLPGITPKALKRYFSEEPAGEKIELEVGKLQEALPRILAAIGERLPDDLPAEHEVDNKPIAELLLQLIEPKLEQPENGSQQLSARAELVFYPADRSTEREVKSRPFRFIAPIGLIEQDELRWYLEEYLKWPTKHDLQRVQTLEAQLPEWGAQLFAEVLGKTACQAVSNAWNNSRETVERRFSVLVETSLLDDASEDEQTNTNEAASRLQSLPWELLHDGKAYLSDGKHPVRIRRRLPNYEQQSPSIMQLPIRILLLSPRPEEDNVSYIDHRASALPLVQAVETLGDLVELKVLVPPTFLALENELRRADEAGAPYHVIHFDGHGVYDRERGLGALCFENSQDSNKPEQRRMTLVHADTLANLLRDYRIPLVFLEACQTAQAGADPSASVAARLLQEGTTSVVAMTHIVLVETARRFVTRFYRALAEGQRVGRAMLDGQQELRYNTFRHSMVGVGELHMQDWFVPILYQEENDPVLFSRLPSEVAQRMTAQQHQALLGGLPDTPEHTFIGRSRELLKAERLLEQQPYVVIRGQGGMGKTTLAVELARWLVQSRRFDRCAFVSVEQYIHERAVVETLLQQLVNSNHNLAAEYGNDIDKALMVIRRVFENERVLIVVDNMESLLADEGNLGVVLQMLVRLEGAKLLLTTRESLPTPFDHSVREIELGVLSQEDAQALVIQVMNNEGLQLRNDDQGKTPQEVSALVETVGCHPRALVLLARELAQTGVIATTANVREIMQELERKYPRERENSLFASMELSLRRLAPDVREQIAGLAVFSDGGNIWSMSAVLEVDESCIRTFSMNLIQVGLAQNVGDYDYIRLDPALPAYLALELNDDQLLKYQQKWVEVIGELIDFLFQSCFLEVELSSQLLLLELPNILSYIGKNINLLDEGEVGAEYLMKKIRSIEQLLSSHDQPQILQQVIIWREYAAQHIKGWSHAQFEYQRLLINRLEEKGNMVAAYHATQKLFSKAQSVGEHAYSGADYDLAMAYFKMGKSSNMVGSSAEALLYLRQAQQLFEKLSTISGVNPRAARMAAKSLAEQGTSLKALGQLDEATKLFLEASGRSETFSDTQQVALIKIHLANIYKTQRLYDDALLELDEALQLFLRLKDVAMVGRVLHQRGVIYRKAGDYLKSERASRESLTIASQRGDSSGEGASLIELGSLSLEVDRLEDSMQYYQRAVKIYLELNDLRYEGFARNNLAIILKQLGRYDEARSELQRSLECKQALGHAATPWVTWGILHELEQASGNLHAALVARQHAMTAYLAYRRDGGENHEGGGRLSLMIGQEIQQGNTEEAQRLVDIELANESWGENMSFVRKLQAVVTGKRDMTLVEDESLHWELAAELILLLEQLNEPAAD